MSGEFSSTWLRLREPADAEARATDLLAPLVSRLGRGPANGPPANQNPAGNRPTGGDLTGGQPTGREPTDGQPTGREPTDGQPTGREPTDGQPTGREPTGRELVIRDLGCGTGSLGRWLAPLLPGPQHWIMEDRDPALLAHAAASMVTTAADGRPVTVRTRRGDVTALGADDLAGTSLVTCSALLDILTAEEVDSIAAALAAHRTTALFTLSVVGTVEFDPADELDGAVTAAFNDHQRRTVAGRRLLGPDAPAAAAEILAKHGARVTLRPSPWRLGRERAALTAEWLRGWTGAAGEQRPDLPIGDYRRRRLVAVEEGALTVTVGHQDLLAEFD